MPPTNMTADLAAPSANSPEGLAALMWLSGAGDHAAFRTLFDAAAPWLFAAAYRITRDSASAAEAVHHTLRQVWRGSGRPEHDGISALAWLLTSVRQRASELNRRRQRDGVAPDLASRGETLGEDLDRLAQDPHAGAFQAAFASLDVEQRHLLALAFLDGLSHAELAQRLRIPIGTARQHVRASLDRLRLALGVNA